MVSSNMNSHHPRPYTVPTSSSTTTPPLSRGGTRISSTSDIITGNVTTTSSTPHTLPPLTSSSSYSSTHIIHHTNSWPTYWYPHSHLNVLNDNHNDTPLSPNVVISSPLTSPPLPPLSSTITSYPPSRRPSVSSRRSSIVPLLFASSPTTSVHIPPIVTKPHEYTTTNQLFDTSDHTVWGDYNITSPQLISPSTTAVPPIITKSHDISTINNNNKNNASDHTVWGDYDVKSPQQSSPFPVTKKDETIFNKYNNKISNDKTFPKRIKWIAFTMGTLLITIIIVLTILLTSPVLVDFVNVQLLTTPNNNNNLNNTNVPLISSYQAMISVFTPFNTKVTTTEFSVNVITKNDLLLVSFQLPSGTNLLPRVVNRFNVTLSATDPNLFKSLCPSSVVTTRLAMNINGRVKLSDWRQIIIMGIPIKSRLFDIPCPQ